MSYKYFIAKRYLISKRELSFISVISVISIIGITVGVAALIVVLSVFNGFNGIVTDILIGFDPHLRIQRTATTTSGDFTMLDSFLRAQTDVTGMAPFVSGKAMIISKSQTKVIFIRGIDPAALERVSGVGKKLVLGNLGSNDPAKRDVVLGFSLSDRLGVVTEDSVWLLSPAGSQQALLGFGAPILKSFRVSGIYESNNKEYDASCGYMSLSSAQTLLRTGNAIHGYEVRLQTIDQSENFKKLLTQKFGTAFVIYSWYDLHKDLYSVMRIERWSAFIILCLIIAIASFNLLGSLTMSVIEKTRDIGILKTMGATRRDIMTIYQFEGIIVGVIGLILGSILGLAVCYLQRYFHLFPLDPTVYIIPAIPIEIRISDFLWISIATLGLSYVASLYPARRAATLLPAEAVRWE